MTTDKLTYELAYCGALVQEHDPDRFLLSLMMPPEVRPALWAVFAFNHEIAKTREIVTETTIGHIRLQWWRDALAKIYDEDAVLQNEILPDLYKAIKDYDLPRDLFDALIYAREFDLENVAPSSLDGLEKYAAFTNEPLWQLALRICGEQEREEAATVQALSVAYGIIGLMRAAPYHRNQQRSFMPADLAAEKEREEVFRIVHEKAMEKLRVQPQSRLMRKVKRLCCLYAKQLKNLHCDPFHPRMALPPAFFHLRFAFWPL